MTTTPLLLVTGATGKVGRVFLTRVLADPRFTHLRVRALCHQRSLPAHERLEVFSRFHPGPRRGE